jgi:hypothetical protein
MNVCSIALALAIGGSVALATWRLTSDLSDTTSLSIGQTALEASAEMISQGGHNRRLPGHGGR